MEAYGIKGMKSRSSDFYFPICTIFACLNDGLVKSLLKISY